MKTAIFQAGIITAPHGVHGEVRVFPTTDDPLHYKKLKTVLMEPVKKTPARAGKTLQMNAEASGILSGRGSKENRRTGAEISPEKEAGGQTQETVQVDGKEYLIYHIRQVKFSKNMAIIQFAEITSMDEAEGYRNRPFYIRREQSVPCGENENFIADLIGMEVRDEDGKILGTLDDVLETGANDVYIVTGADGGEILIPAIRDCILRVSVEENLMTVHLLPGLV